MTFPTWVSVDKKAKEMGFKKVTGRIYVDDTGNRAMCFVKVDGVICAFVGQDFKGATTRRKR